MLSAAILAVAVASTAPGGEHPGDLAPNVVVILIDDMGWTDLACYGSDLHETPHIDQLAAEGMKFTDAYATCPVCSPTRASLMTGQYPARLNITDWIPGVHFPHALLLEPEFCQELPLEMTTLAEVMRGGGYRTLHVGKWHLGDEPYYPEHQGFDVNIAGHSKGAPGSYFHPYQQGNERGGLWDVKNMPPGGEEGDYLTDRLTDEAITLLKAEGNQPFFLYLSFYAVHTPIMGRPDLLEHYKAKDRTDLNHTNAAYAAMVHAVDENVGRLMDAIRSAVDDRPTMVLLTSDNGGLVPTTSNAPLRMGKGWMYEGGIREPFIAWYPGVVAAGAVSDEVITTNDILPTVCAATNVPLPENQVLDGVDLMPVLRDPKASLHERDVYWHYPHYHTPQKRPSGAVRSGRYKLIEWYETGDLELYDLIDDPGEQNNLVSTAPEAAAILQKNLHDWRTRVGARECQPNPDYDAKNPWRGQSAKWDDRSEPCDCPGRSSAPLPDASSK